jgi:AcrR family transcriptional regulator
MTTERGEATRARLIEATAEVVGEVGYANASTRAIARAAGVAEGTIYRHFPNKAAMFLAAAVDRNDPTVKWMSGLPSRAGQDTVEENLTDCLVRLSALRQKMLPLELALLTDPELAGQQRLVAFGPPEARPVGPPEYIAEYLAAEQKLSRVRADVAADRMATVILATLFGLSVPRFDVEAGLDRVLLATAVRMLLTGIEPAAPRA